MDRGAWRAIVRGLTKSWTHLTLSRASRAHACKFMLEILLARLQHYMSQELPDVLAGFRKGKRTREQMANIHWIIEKARESQKKTSTSVSSPVTLTVWIIINFGMLLERWKYETILVVSWETCMQVKMQQFRTLYGTTDQFRIEKGVWQGCLL